MPTPSAEEVRRAAVALALRSAVASVICLLVVAWLHLENGALSVYTAHVINLQYSQTPFQKGLERIVGRLAGILGTLTIFLLLRQTPMVCLAVAAVVMFGLYYVQSSGRFAYGIMMAGIFSMTTLAAGISSPTSSMVEIVWPTVVQLFLGVFVAEVVNFMTGLEKSITITPGGQPMFPIRREYLSRALRLTLTSFTAVFVPLAVGLPLTTTAVAAVAVSTAPDSKGMGWKGWLRILAVLIGAAYALVCLIILIHVQMLILLALMVFLGMFLGTYIAKTHPSYSYLGLQLGIVLGQVLVVPANQVVDLDKAGLRLIGALVGVVIAVAFQELWPRSKPG
jgi:uncharacterized membrane protein YccC